MCAYLGIHLEWQRAGRVISGRGSVMFQCCLFI